MKAEDATPEERFVDSIGRMAGQRGEIWSRGVIAAAETALVEGLDTPALRILAGQPSDEEDATRLLLEAAFAELSLRNPQRSAGMMSRTGPRMLARDSIGFRIVPSDAAYGGHEVRILVNDTAVIPEDLAGMDPQRLFLPTNSLVAGSSPQTVWIARSRTEVDDVSAYVKISRDGDVVRWSWGELRLCGEYADGFVFPAAEYDREVARIDAERSWESPLDTITRALFERVDHAGLERRGIALRWVTPSRRVAQGVNVSLSSLTDGAGHHSFWADLDFAWDGREVDAVIESIVTELS
jgi:hypothetical protein